MKNNNKENKEKYRIKVVKKLKWSNGKYVDRRGKQL